MFMGRLMGGPYYFLVGRTGNNVGRVRNGKNTFSMRPHPSSKPPTEAQLAVRVPFGIFTAWLSWISPIIEIGFQEHDEDESAMNAAVGYNIKNAITGVYPMQAIDYPNVLLSRGKVSGPSSPVMATTVDAQLDISWSDVIESTIGSLTDMATFVVYNPSREAFAVRASVVARSVESYDILLPSAWSTENVHVYMIFVAVGGKAVSNSAYLGAIVVM